MIWVVIGLIVIGGLFHYARKAGKDAVKAEVAEKTVEDIVDANKPAADAELERVRGKYRRD